MARRGASDGYRFEGEIIEEVDAGGRRWIFMRLLEHFKARRKLEDLTQR